MWTRQLRRIVQIAILIFFALSVWHATWSGDGKPGAPPRLLTADPLSMLTTLLADGLHVLSHFRMALIILAATILLGRFFCGWICPLGTCIDISDKLIARKRRKARGQFPQLKYYILAAVLLATLLGSPPAWILDPIPLLTRTLSLFLYPLAVAGYNLGVTHGRGILLALGLRVYPVETVGFSLQSVVGVMFLAILLLGLLSRRYWCRNLCPLGALLALVGRFGLWKRQVQEEGCVGCGLCYSSCKMGAIPADRPHVTQTAECILCYDCAICPRPTVTHITLSRRLEKGADAAVDIQKRHLLAGLGVGAAYAVAAGMTGRRTDFSPRLLRPPGAIVRTPQGPRPMTEEQFQHLCLRCGACMRACPTNGLQPAVTEAGLFGVFTPVLVPRIGECTPECTACGDVCPSGALVPFQAAEKQNDIIIGKAVIDENTCLAWQKGRDYKLCLVCDEQCPYDAIQMQEHGPWAQKRPHVITDKCTGCGKCEHECPVTPIAAIRVMRVGAEG